MIQARLQINGEIRGREQITGNINGSVKNIYPELENLEINPTTQKQYLKSEKYGYNEITVNEVTSAIDKNIKSEYIKNGITILGVDGKFEGIDTSDATAEANDILKNKTAYVNGKKIEGTIPNNGILNYKPSKELQEIPSGYTDGGTILGIISEELNIIPNIETQIYYGKLFDKVTVLGDEELKSENIKEGINIFNVEGSYKGIDTSDASAKAINILDGKTAYVNGEKIQGTMPNNGQLSYLPTFENQTIPEGYTEGGIIAGIEAEEIKITPSGTEQIAEGLFNKVTVEAVNNNYNAVFSPPTATFEFKYCLREIANLDLSIVTSMYRAFYQCVYLTKIGKFLNASNVTNIQSMFYDCRNIQGEINLENFGTVTDVYDAFNCCAAVEKIVLPPLNVTNYYQTFYGCIALKEIVGLNVNNITNYYMAFYNCQNINNLKQLNGNKVTNVKNTFGLTYALENFGGILNLGKAYTNKTVNYANYTLNLSSAPLTHESLMNVINGLYTIKTAQSLVLGANNLAKLTSDEIAIATNKGWNVS